MLGDIKKIPKYIRVSWKSSFPGEEERLFYGRNVFFAVTDVAEAASHTKHPQELALFNMFQKVVLNEEVQWTVDEKAMKDRVEQMGIEKQWDVSFYAELWEQKQREEEEDALAQNVNALASMLRGRIDADSASYVHHVAIALCCNLICIVSEIKSLFTSEYSEKLFNGFCAHRNRTQIAIRNFKRLPPKLGEALFSNGFPRQLKLCQIEKIFPSALKLTLNHLDKHQMIAERKQLVRDVQDLIETNTQLIEVSIQSAPHERIQESVELKRITADARIGKKLKVKGWSVAYTFQKEVMMHRLVFSIDKDEKIKEQGRKIMKQGRTIKEQAHEIEELDHKCKELVDKDLGRQMEMEKAQKENAMLKAEQAHKIKELDHKYKELEMELARRVEMEKAQKENDMIETGSQCGCGFCMLL